ncbi:MAG: DUF1861 family protein, partial [Saccharofermentanales bacterium]
REMTQCKMISDRRSFPMGPQKNSRAWDVTFTSGIIRQGDGKAMLYTGLSDCECGEAEIDDPFIEYEI